MSERGLDGTTMSAIIERSGVARATVYLRWPSRAALLTAATRRTMGRGVITLTGETAADLGIAMEQMQHVLGQPGFRAVLPALIAGLTTPAVGERLSYEAVAPGAELFGDEYDAIAAGQGFRADIPGRLLVDAALGAMLGLYLARGRPPSDRERDLVVNVLVEGARRR